MEKVLLRTEKIKLDSLLKYAGVAGTGGEAKHLIVSGSVLVDGKPCTERGKKISSGSIISVNGHEFMVEAQDEKGRMDAD